VRREVAIELRNAQAPKAHTDVMHCFKAIRLYSIQRERRDEPSLALSGIVVAARYVRRNRPGYASLPACSRGPQDPLEAPAARLRPDAQERKQ
jgi:hypothetical protein